MPRAHIVTGGMTHKRRAKLNNAFSGKWARAWLRDRDQDRNKRNKMMCKLERKEKEGR